MTEAPSTIADTAARPFGTWTATALIVGGMIGSGIFLLPTALAPYGWTGVLAWIVSIGGALAIAYAIARMTRAMPQETGAIAITGAVLGVVPGVLVGWAYWVSTWAAVAAIAIAATSYLSALIPSVNATPMIGALVAVGMIWAMTLINLAGAAMAGRFQIVTTVLKLLPLIAVGLITVALMVGGTTPLPPLPSASTAMIGLGAAITLTLFPLLGFETAGVIAERVRDPGRTVMRATMIGTALTGVIYILVSSGIALTLPTEALLASPAPFALFVETHVGAASGTAVAGLAALAAVGALNCWVLMQGETPLGMARAGLLPRWFARVSRRDVPVPALILSSILASLLVLANASKSLAGVFEFAALLTTCSSLWLYLAITTAAILRRQAVAISSLGLAFSLLAMWGAGWEASGLSLLLMLTGLPLYWLRGR